LLFRTVAGAAEALLVHRGEGPLEAVLREFREEMGQSVRGDSQREVGFIDELVRTLKDRER
jgi:hypothetical protein